MQAVDDVDFGQRLMRPPAQFVPGLLERQRVRAGIARPQPRERAEQAGGDADVRRFDPDVVVVVGARSVALLALAVGQPSQSQQVRRFEQADAVGKREPLARRQLVGDLDQASIPQTRGGKGHAGET
jgi:hypothetical protein